VVLFLGPEPTENPKKGTGTLSTLETTAYK